MACSSGWQNRDFPDDLAGVHGPNLAADLVASNPGLSWLVQAWVGERQGSEEQGAWSYEPNKQSKASVRTIRLRKKQWRGTPPHFRFFEPVDRIRLPGQLGGVKKKPAKVEEAAVPYAAKKPAKAGKGWQQHIVVDPAVLIGKPVVKGTRLAVEFVLGLLAQGWSEAEILRNYPGLTREQILACVAYAQARLGEEKVFATAG